VSQPESSAKNSTNAPSAAHFHSAGRKENIQKCTALIWREIKQTKGTPSMTALKEICQEWFDTGQN